MNAGIAVYIDYENVRRVGTSLFAPNFGSDENIVCPSLIADTVASRRPSKDPVVSIVVARGEPSRHRDPIAASRFRRDREQWARDPRVHPLFRPLHYGPNGSVKESGVDMSLALKFVEAAKSRRYESVVLITGDSDFGPALDAAATGGRRVELAFWSGRRTGFGNSLADYAVRQKHLYSHRLTEDDYWNCLPDLTAAA